MRKITAVFVPAALWLCGASLLGSAEAASTSPGKNAVYASTAAAIVPDQTATTVLTATIEKGKKKRVLEVFVSFKADEDSQSETGALFTVFPIVNGLSIMEPTEGGTTVESGGSGYPPLTQVGEFWLDLDAAEAAHPGQFIKQPLVIELRVRYHSNPPGQSIIGAGVLRARLEKK